MPDSSYECSAAFLATVTVIEQTTGADRAVALGWSGKIHPAGFTRALMPGIHGHELRYKSNAGQVELWICNQLAVGLENTDQGTAEAAIRRYQFLIKTPYDIGVQHSPITFPEPGIRKRHLAWWRGYAVDLPVKPVCRVLLQSGTGSKLYQLGGLQNSVCLGAQLCTTPGAAGRIGTGRHRGENTLYRCG